jgi:amidase
LTQQKLTPDAQHPDQKGQLVMRYPIDPFTPAVELAAAIRRKEVSPVEVVDSYLERMDELDPRLNAFCHRADDNVRKAASAAADAVVRAVSTEDLPPFHGVPLPIKDLLDVAGWPTTHGSAGATQAPAAVSDPVVQRFVDAGFVLLGKTTTLGEPIQGFPPLVLPSRDSAHPAGAYLGTQ